MWCYGRCYGRRGSYNLCYGSAQRLLRNAGQLVRIDPSLGMADLSPKSAIGRVAARAV